MRRRSSPATASSREHAQGALALDKATGKRLWSHDFMREYGSPSARPRLRVQPLLYNGTVIVPVGGRGQGMAAFDQHTGALVWKAGDFDESPASPLMIEVDGQPQLVAFAGDRVAGIDSRERTRLLACAAQDRLGAEHQHPGVVPLGSPAVRVGGVQHRKPSDRAAPVRRQDLGGREVVQRPDARPHRHDHPPRRSRLRVERRFRAGVPHRDRSESGKIVWQDRSFARAQLLYADNKLIVLDEDGNLGLATVSPQGLKVLARAAVLSNVAWTPPTLSGTTLYARDRKTISAFSLAP
jgi:hypothetical protein